MVSLRRTTHTGWPRHSTTRRPPTSILLISTVTGAPAFFARALGCQDFTKGTAANPAPTAATPVVAATRKVRRLVLTPSLLIGMFSPRIQRPVVIGRIADTV